MAQHIGIIGGGQLGRMIIQAAISYSVVCHVYDPHEDAPARPFCQYFTQGAFMDEEAIVKWGQACDVITYEIEHVSVPALQRLKQQGKTIIPDPDLLEMIQDKGSQKQFYKRHQIPTAPFECWESIQKSQQNAIGRVVKIRRLGYDGRGVWMIDRKDQLATIPDKPILIEDRADIAHECAIIIARNKHGTINILPAVEAVYHKECNLVDYLMCPAEVPYISEMKNIAQNIAEIVALEGILAIEFFVTQHNKVWVNEMAPRPHNSGHHTIEALASSQYDQLVRCLCGLPLGSTRLIQPAAMLNIVGGVSGKELTSSQLEKLYSKPNRHIHLYGKAEWKPFRKMGHITILGDNQKQLIQEINQIKKELADE